jgi:hypothetical protein
MSFPESETDGPLAEVIRFGRQTKSVASFAGPYFRTENRSRIELNPQPVRRYRHVHPRVRDGCVVGQLNPALDGLLGPNGVTCRSCSHGIKNELDRCDATGLEISTRFSDTSGHRLWRTRPASDRTYRRRNSSSAALTSSGCVQPMLCGPCRTSTTSRLAISASSRNRAAVA